MTRDPRLAAAALAASLLLSPAAAQDADRDLQVALEAEARQVALVERLSPSVAAVFPGEGPPQGGGSGVIIDPQGYVLTNFHVSGTAAVLTVGLNDGRRYRAFLLGIDPGGDIALLKLTGREHFPAVPLGESDALRVGERVFAMGNPFLLAEDFSPTVTQGVVSGVHRYRDGAGGADLVYGDCIQMDASINPGNSGGPLFNERGELLGINGLGGFRPDRVRINVGVGYAASIDQIKNFLLDLRAGKQCQHGTMNATVRDVPEEDGNGTNLVVDALTQSSNAYQAGLRLGDRVVALDGTPVTSQNRLLTEISRLPAGRRVLLSVERPREDGAGTYSLEFGFRLQPLWSGPESGAWQPNEALVAAELAATLAAHREAAPEPDWALEESVTLADGRSERRVTRLRGRELRVETGPRGQEVADVYDGERGFRVVRSGGRDEVVPLPLARRDLLAGTAEALAGLAREGGQEHLSRLSFEGGEWIGGRWVIELETRDKAGRRRLVYLDQDTHRLAGLAYRLGERWVEETWLRGPDGGLTIERRDYDSGELIERSRARVVVEPQNPSLFERE